MADDLGNSGAELPPQPSEEELRAQMEEELKRVRVEDLLLQSVASLINLTARRIAKPDERDLAQARAGIDAVTALVDKLPAEVQGQIRNALSELQVLYAREAGEGSAAGEPAAAAPETASGEPQTPPEPRPSEPSTTPQGTKVPPKLWTPGRPQ